MVRVLHYALLTSFGVIAVSLYHIWGYDRAWRTMQSVVNAWQSSEEGTSIPQFMTLPSSLVPTEYRYDLDANAPYPFLDGRHIGYRVHPLPLELAIAQSRSHSPSSGAPFWPGNSLDKNLTGKEDGSIWAGMEQMDMVLAYDPFDKMLWEGKERRGEYVQRAKIQSNDSPPFEGWNRIAGRMRLMFGASGALSLGRKIQYDLVGLHNERDGTCRIYGFPQGRTPNLQHAQRFLERSLEDYDMGKEEVITLSKIKASELPATWLMSRLQGTFIFADLTMIEYRSWPYGIVAWQVVQISILFAQSMYSPNSRYLPPFLAPKFYASSYQPPFTTELRAALNLCDSPTCHICYEAIRFPQPPLDLDNAEKCETGINNQAEEVVGDDEDHLLPEIARSEEEGKEEVVTLHESGEAPAADDWAVGPCGHVWHMTCLEKWLAISPICPLCTLELPPLLLGDADTRSAMGVIIGM
ncbi:hypothetical protein L202_04517 [Cryptococcus amylolentus CBS 6039]|uniref:Zinc finger RING-H2-type domain-containing protein n=1 Tax=Cryptococcus amylolentus CBS 6039 TaxID=1295533 RepID=A0A1E3HRM7_9TREE|nr:hypothetical protein L202_04517 [Cryptococcus amylolentus CBS 6039]ODN79009.1 hypothetical protein L202_04517 [Cryptococcus amylolentus CBS 6039]